MSKKSGFLASITIIGILTFGMTFTGYKAVNEYIDGYANQIRNFLAIYGLNLTIEQFWIALFIFFIISIIVVISRSD